MEGNYKHRVVDTLLERKLLGKGAGAHRTADDEAYELMGIRRIEWRY